MSIGGSPMEWPPKPEALKDPARNCAGLDTEMFFPGKGESNVAHQSKQVCFGCVVQVECATHALGVVSLHGTWGGLTAREREDIRAGRKPVPAWLAAAA